MTIDAKIGWQKSKYIKDRDSRANLRYKIILERYYFGGEHLERLANEIGMSLSGAEKIVNKINKEYGQTKRQFIGEALDDPIVIYRQKPDESYIVYFCNTAKQITEAGFKWANTQYALINQTFTKKMRKRYYVCLAKDFDAKLCDDIKIRQKIAKIKMKNIFR